MALDFMAGKLSASGVRSVRLHVRGDNTAAILLYEKHGFVRSGTDLNFYGEGVHASVYTLDIA
jgi:ribosomal protein S18 acetylase RimI-like enzyme